MRLIVLVLVVAASLAGGFLLGRRGAATAAAPEREAAAADDDAAPRRVRIGHVRRAALERHVRVVGTITSAAARAVAAPFDAVVVRLPHPVGTRVDADAVLVDLAPTPAARAARAQALADEAASAKALEIVEQRLSAGLATIADRQQAEQAAAAARRAADDWRARLAGDDATITATAPAVVAACAVAEGQWVTAGTELVRLSGAPIARFGLEPSDAAAIRPRATIRITTPRRPAASALELQVTSIAAAVDPDSHLIDALVDLPADHGSAIGEAVVGEIAVTLPLSLVVPRDAIAPAQGGRDGGVFIITDAHAHVHAITAIGSAADEVAITADGIAEGDAIAVSGVHALADGDAVEAVDAAGTEPAGAPEEDAAKP